MTNREKLRYLYGVSKYVVLTVNNKSLNGEVTDNNVLPTGKLWIRQFITTEWLWITREDCRKLQAHKPEEVFTWLSTKVRRKGQQFCTFTIKACFHFQQYQTSLWHEVSFHNVYLYKTRIKISFFFYYFGAFMHLPDKVWIQSETTYEHCRITGSNLRIIVFFLFKMNLNNFLLTIQSISWLATCSE